MSAHRGRVMIYWIAFLSTLSVNFVTAVLGRAPERIAAAMFVTAQFATMVLSVLGPEHLPSGVSWDIVMVDAAVCLGLFTLALRTSRRWVLFATALSALCLASWLAMALDLRISYTVGLFAVSFWSTLSMFSALIGASAVRHRAWGYAAAALQCTAGISGVAWVSGVTRVGADDMILLAACETGTVACLIWGAAAGLRQRRSAFPDR